MADHRQNLYGDTVMSNATRTPVSRYPVPELADLPDDIRPHVEAMLGGDRAPRMATFALRSMFLPDGDETETIELHAVPALRVEVDGGEGAEASIRERLDSIQQEIEELRRLLIGDEPAATDQGAAGRTMRWHTVRGVPQTRVIELHLEEEHEGEEE